MKQVHEREAALGDMTVCSLPAEGIAGSVVGVSNHSGSVLVRWDSECMDVIDVGSPLWAVVSVYRDEPEPLRIGIDGSMSIGGKAVVGVVHDCMCGRGEEPCPGTDGRPLCATATFETVYDGHQPGVGFTLPWADVQEPWYDNGQPCPRTPADGDWKGD